MTHRLSLYSLMSAALITSWISNTAYAIEEIAVIGTRSENSLSNLPSNISVLNAEQLNTIKPIHIQQALSQVPGVNYQRGNGQESLPSIRSAVLTGAGACGSVLVLEEAIPVRGVGSCNVNELFDTHFEQAGQIEVVRGANSAFYGSNSLTGSINVSLPASGQNQASLEFGENEFVRAKAAIGYKQNDTSFGRFYATVSHDGGFRDDSGYEQTKLSWRHQTQINDWSVSAGATYTNLDQETAGFIVGRNSFLDPVLREQNLDPEAFRETESFRAWAKFNRQLTDKTSLQITPYVRATDMDFRLHFLPGDPLEQNSQTGIGWQSALNTQVSQNLSWSIGLDGEFSDSELIQTQDAPTQGSAFLQETIPTGTQYDYQVDSIQLGGFAHINWRLNQQLRLIAGARLETVRYDYDNRSLDGRTRDDGSECGFGGCRYSRPADREDNFTNFSPRFELQYTPSESIRWHASVANTFRAPQATELYRLQGDQTVAGLDSVQATTIEAGVQWQAQRSLLGINIYTLDQRNLIIRDSDQFNIDGQRTDSVGLEINAKHQLSERWSARIVATFADHQYDSDLVLEGANINGNEVDTAPSFFGSAFLAWQANSVLFAELEIQRVGSYFLDVQNQSDYPGHTLLNLRGHYQASDNINISLRALNLANRSFAERADFTTFTDERYFPGEPRSFFAEIAWSF